MKIGIEAQRIFRKKRFGLDIFSLELIQHLQLYDTKNEYFVLARTGENKSGFDLFNPKFQLVEFDAPSYPLWEQVKLPRIASQLGLDLLHCTNNTSPLFSKVPIVLTLHDTIFLDSIEIFDLKIPLYQSWGNLYRKFIVSNSIKKVKKVVSISDYEKNLIMNRFSKDKEKITRIYTCVGDEFFVEYDNIKQKMIRDKYNIKEDFLLFLGNFHPRKNMLGVVRGFDRFKKKNPSGLKLLITNISENEFIEFCNKHSINTNIHDYYLPGYLCRNDMLVFYFMSKILLYPSIREGFGLPVLEAFSMGVPVITSTLSSLPEIAGKGALLVDPYSDEEISSAISKLISDKELQSTLKNEAALQLKLFSWEQTAKSYIELYNSLHK